MVNSQLIHNWYRIANKVSLQQKTLKIFVFAWTSLKMYCMVKWDKNGISATELEKMILKDKKFKYSQAKEMLMSQIL